MRSQLLSHVAGHTPAPMTDPSAGRATAGNLDFAVRTGGRRRNRAQLQRCHADSGCRSASVLLRLLGLALAGLLLQLAGGVGVARGDACPAATPSYLGPCGPTYVLPGWGDAAGWTDPSKYSTIQLADVNGDGKAELLARNDDGIEIWEFDTTVGQWRPAVDANGVRQVLSDFRSPLPGERDQPNWTEPQYYSTIQTANVDGQPGAEVLGRFPDGIHVYKYVPPAGTNSIDGGTWKLLSKNGPFSDAQGFNDLSAATTIQTYGNGPADLIGVSPTQGLENYQWNGTGWTPLTGLPGFSCCTEPYFLGTLQAGNPYGLAPALWNLQSGNPPMPGGGWTGQAFLGGSAGWQFNLDGSPPQTFNGPDPGLFAPDGSGPFDGIQNTTQWGSSAAYWRTIRFANIAGRANSSGRQDEEMLGRGVDGLEAYELNAQGVWTQLATLTALSDANGFNQPKYYNTITYADIDGDGRQEVLARGPQGLVAYKYNPTSNSWSQLPGMINLADDPWGSDPSYYGTIRAGDITGDGQDAVIARGPYGIRTWFYNRRGTGGWERYLPDGYPAFPTAGQQAAFTALSTQAKAHGVIPLTASSVRDVWDQENAPAPSDLSQLQQGVLSLAACTGLNPGNPPSFQSCTPPAGSTGFTAADWTAVINEVLSEIFDAQQVVAHFGQLDQLRQKIFISQNVELPAIDNQLQMAGAAGNSASFDLQGLFAGIVQIAGSIAGISSGEGGAALSITADLMGMIPSADSAAMDTYITTYAGLQNQLPTIEQQAFKALGEHSFDVRSDLGLLTLVGQLRSRGTWTLDSIGLQSAANEGFALWAYQALLPTMYQRYVVTGCTSQFEPYGPDNWTCNPVPAGPGVIGGGVNATWLGPPIDANPCPANDCQYQSYPGTIPASVANIVWGSVSPSCDYQPGNPNTQWTFGCSLGVPPNEGIGANVGGWNFNTTSGSPLMQYDPGDVLGGALRAAGSSGGTMPAHEASKRVPSPDLLGTLRFTGEVHVSQAVSLARLRVVIDRTLYAHDLAREVAQTPAKRRLRPFTLRYARGGLFISTRRGGPRVRLRLRRLDNRGRVKLDLVIIGVRTRHIRTLCGDVLGADLLNGRTLDLETRLRIRDGHSIQTLTLRQGWRCRSDRRGDFAGITPIRPRPVVRRPGLAVRLRLPRTVAPGRSVPALVTIINRRSRRAQRVVSALWHLRIFATAGRRARMTRVRELRAGRSITVRFTVPLRVDHGRACVTVEARADSARVAVARRCVPIAAATPSRAAARDSEPPVSAFANATTIDRPLAAPAFVLGSWCSASNVGSAPSPCIPSMGLSAHGGRWAGM